MRELLQMGIQMTLVQVKRDFTRYTNACWISSQNTVPYCQKYTTTDYFFDDFSIYNTEGQSTISEKKKEKGKQTFVKGFLLFVILIFFVHSSHESFKELFIH